MDWAELSEEDLLGERICDLKLTIRDTPLEGLVNQLYDELSQQGLHFFPKCYLADEWFVPEGDTVIGIPFYLAHSRLRRLERKMMLEVEGEGKREFMKLLRHEAGHAVYYAYRLQKNRHLRKLFGHDSKKPSPYFRPKPYSRSYVVHLDNWYAQTEPDEDFAETFAVWLSPHIHWKKAYKGWKAIKKLEFMDQLMGDLSGKPPPVLTKEYPYAASAMRAKLKTFYYQKQKIYAEDYPDFYDSDLKKIFSADVCEKQCEMAGRFMARYRKAVLDSVARWTGEKKFMIQNIFKNMKERCQELELRLDKEETVTILELTAYLAAMVSNQLFTGKLKRKR